MKQFASITLLLVAMVLLTACPQKSDTISVTNDAALKAVQATARTEPVFYNGKTYTLDLTPAGNGQFALKVSPMKATQEKDAVAVATSSVGYFACPGGKAGKLAAKPQFTGQTWKMTAVCS
jgi:hypothetical protein